MADEEEKKVTKTKKKKTKNKGKTTSNRSKSPKKEKKTKKGNKNKDEPNNKNEDANIEKKETAPPVVEKQETAPTTPAETKKEEPEAATGTNIREIQHDNHDDDVELSGGGASNNYTGPKLKDQATARSYYASLLEQRLQNAPSKDQEALKSKWEPHELATFPVWEGIRSGMSYPLQWRGPIARFHYTWGEYIIFLILLPGFIGASAVGGEEGSGVIASIPFALTFCLAAHNSIFTFLFGIPFERALIYHKACAYSAVICGAIHGVLAGMDDEEGITGIILCSVMGLLILTSFAPIRRRLFEVFFYLHWVLFLVSIAFAFIHEASLVAVGAGLWVVDLLARLYLIKIRNPQKVSIVRCPSDVVRISFPKNGVEYKPGQYMFICVPKLGFFQWHPFSLSSAPWEPDVHLHVRVLGNWTKALYELADGEKSQEIDAFVEGPYGEPITDIEGDRYKCFLLVSGGIGVTPMQSICNQLLYEFARGRPICKIWFVWCCRDKFMLDAVLAYNAEYYQEKLNSGRLPKSFSPDMLLSTSLSIRGGDHFQQEESLEKDTNKGLDNDDNQGDPLHAEFYLTKHRSPEDFDMACINPSLQKSLRFGRPKLDAIFDKMKEIAKEAGEDKVAALCCGPDAIIHQMKVLSKSKSDNDVTFDCHHETFDF